MQTILKSGAFVIVLGCCSAPALAQMGPGAGFRHEGDEGAYRRPHAARLYGSGGYRGDWGGGVGYGHGYGAHRALRYGYATRRFGYGVRAWGYAHHRRVYGSYDYSHRPRVRYAYAETPYAYDLPRETYATGIFPTNAALGLHTYDYAYTTRVRPIAAYGGATGSYAGGYPIYNRPLAPAYPTPGCDCD
jgi:hypothetical protein